MEWKNQYNVRIQDDLYEYVNSGWLDKAEVPAQKQCTGSREEIEYKIEKELNAVINKMDKRRIPMRKNTLKNMTRLYRLGANGKKREENGIRPIEKELELIESLTDLKTFNRKLKELFFKNIPLPFTLKVIPDLHNPGKKCLEISAPDVIISDKLANVDEMEETHDSLRAGWATAAHALLSLAPLNEEEQKEYIQDTINFDTAIFEHCLSPLDKNDPVKMFNRVKLSSVTWHMGTVKLRRFLRRLYHENLPSEIIISDVPYLKKFTSVFNDLTFRAYKHWAYVKYIMHYAQYLAQQNKQTSDLILTTFRGMDIPDHKTQAFNVAREYFKYPLGEYYAENFIKEGVKEDVIKITEKIRGKIIEKITDGRFFVPGIKEKAIEKIQKVKVNLATPCGSPLFDLMKVNSKDDFYHAVHKLDCIKKTYEFAHLNDPAEAVFFQPSYYETKIFYNPARNEVNIPLGILQYPYYAKAQPTSATLGALGNLIARAMIHAVDYKGNEYDASGSLSHWWNGQQYDRYIFRWIPIYTYFEDLRYDNIVVPGALVSESVFTDLLAMDVTLALTDELKDPNYFEYFTNWARMFCFKTNEFYYPTYLESPVSAPAKHRANLTPLHFKQWYQTFNVKPTDKLYIPKKAWFRLW